MAFFEQGMKMFGLGRARGMTGDPQPELDALRAEVETLRSELAKAKGEDKARSEDKAKGDKPS